jgi:nucleotide-binding universal stress UspA family protein
LKTQTIVAAFDGSPNAEKAAHFALQLAKAFQARLLLVFVVPPYMPEAELPPPNILEVEEMERLAADQTLKEMQAKLDANGVTIATQTVIGKPGEEIVRLCENPEVGMAVVGRTGKGAIARLLLGSVTQTLARTCPKPIIIVP